MNTGHRRFFINLPEPIRQFPHTLTVSDPFVVDHVLKVLRLKPGEQLIVINTALNSVTSGSPDAYLARLETHGGGRKAAAIAFTLIEAIAAPASRSPQIVLGAALIKEQRWDWLLQKTTELGVRQIIPLITAHGVVRPEQHPKTKQARWQAITQAAAQQSEGWFMPTVSLPATVADFCARSEGIPVKLLLLERGESIPTLKARLDTIPYLANQTIAIAIGPEGGWQAEEVEIFQQAGFQAVSLGDRILRSETAAIAAISNVMYESLV